MMQSPQQPSATHFILDVVNAFPGRLRTGAVRHPQKNAGNELDRESESQCAPPDIAPARPAGNVLIQSFVNHLPAARAVVKPVKEAGGYFTRFEGLHAAGIF